MSSWYHKIDFHYDRKSIERLYFDKVHHRLLTEAPEESKKLHHLGTPGIPQDMLKLFPKNFYSNCEKFFNKIGNTFNVSTNFFARFFMVAPEDSGVIHIDTYAGKDQVRKWALNLPVFNTDNNYHEMVDIDCSLKIFNSADPMFLWPSKTPYTILDSMVLDQPTIVDVSVPHRINNPTKNYRVIISIRSSDNSIPYESIRKIF